jgi:purine-nucleoside phosphorylase
MAIPPYEQATEASRFILSRCANVRPQVAVVLGSGLGDVASAMSDPTEIPYNDIPHFVKSTVEGHEGKLVAGTVGGTSALIMKGRFHFYEGYSMEQVTHPVRVFGILGVQSLVLTNAAGGISPSLSPGDLMLITDHLNLMGDNPLRGPNDPRFGPRFPDMSKVYSRELASIARDAASASGVSLSEGIYAGLRGPMYETPAEIRMLRGFGADAVGMSTVPEAIAARHSDIRVLAISCITNTAAGLGSEAIDHDEVIAIGKRASGNLTKLLLNLIPKVAAIVDGPKAT